MTLTLKAQVRGGRLVLDEPTELPEGSELRREFDGRGGVLGSSRWAAAGMWCDNFLQIDNGRGTAGGRTPAVIGDRRMSVPRPAGTIARRHQSL